MDCSALLQFGAERIKPTARNDRGETRRNQTSRDRIPKTDYDAVKGPGDARGKLFQGKG